MSLGVIPSVRLKNFKDGDYKIKLYTIEYAQICIHKDS